MRSSDFLERRDLGMGIAGLHDYNITILTTTFSLYAQVINEDYESEAVQGFHKVVRVSKQKRVSYNRNAPSELRETSHGYKPLHLPHVDHTHHSIAAFPLPAPLPSGSSFSVVVFNT
jgi:hypothetical protein